MLCRVLEKHTTGDASSHSFAQWPKWNTANDYRLDGSGWYVWNGGLQPPSNMDLYRYAHGLTFLTPKRTDISMLAGSVANSTIQITRFTNIAIFWFFFVFINHPTIVEIQIGWVTQAVTSHLTLAVGSLHLPSPDSTRSSASGRLRTSRKSVALAQWGNVKLTEQQLKLSILLVVNLFGHAWTRTMRTPACN